MIRHGSIGNAFRRLWGSARLRLLFLTTLAGLVFGAIELGEPLEDSLHMMRNTARSHDASGDIVLIAIDDKSLKELGQWPWPRSYYGKLSDRLREAGAKRVFFDIDFSSTSNQSEDAAFAQALQRLNGRATLALRFVIDPVSGERTDNFPIAGLRKASGLAHINFRYSGKGAVWDIPYSLNYGDRVYPSFAASMANSYGPEASTFPIDYSIDPRTVRVISAVDLVNGRVPPEAIRGKDALIGTTSLQLGDIAWLPGHGRMAGAYIHLLGAETLKQGQPRNFGWLLPFLFGLAVAAGVLYASRRRYSVGLFLGGTTLLFLVPLVLESNLIFAQTVPALSVLFVSSGTQAWRSFRRYYSERARINPVSGLPNLSALREAQVAAHQVMVAARVQNYPEICATLPVGAERALVEQIAGRLIVAAPSTTLYQGDEGIFAWLVEVEAEAHLEEHLNALHSLFRNPIVVAASKFDLAITFGIEAGSARSTASRFAGALVAADEAAAELLRWKKYDPGQPEEAAWKLSLLSQLDSAIDAGDLWVAYQPKFRLPNRQIVGAEALVRWTHPEKGAIGPMEFIPAAEQSGRIEKLTEFVLDRAVRAAALINRRGVEFTMSVNISPKLLGRFPLESVVMELLARYRLPPERLMLEVTETAALAGTADLRPLHNLRGRGVHISIDDYGTGLSTLDYIKRIPASEIKIDKSFVQAIDKSNSDRIMVSSTIQLAHSLGRQVVAEGVEDLTTLETLTAMECDLVQGFYLAKPMTLKDLSKILSESNLSHAA